MKYTIRLYAGNVNSAIEAIEASTKAKVISVTVYEGGAMEFLLQTASEAAVDDDASEAAVDDYTYYDDDDYAYGDDDDA